MKFEIKCNFFYSCRMERNVLRQFLDLLMTMPVESIPNTLLAFSILNLKNDNVYSDMVLEYYDRFALMTGQPQPVQSVCKPQKSASILPRVSCRIPLPIAG